MCVLSTWDDLSRPSLGASVWDAAFVPHPSCGPSLGQSLEIRPTGMLGLDLIASRIQTGPSWVETLLVGTTIHKTREGGICSS